MQKLYFQQMISLKYFLSHHISSLSSHLSITSLDILIIDIAFGLLYETVLSQWIQQALSQSILRAQIMYAGESSLYRYVPRNGPYQLFMYPCNVTVQMNFTSELAKNKRSNSAILLSCPDASLLFPRLSCIQRSRPHLVCLVCLHLSPQLHPIESQDLGLTSFLAKSTSTGLRSSSDKDLRGDIFQRQSPPTRGRRMGRGASFQHPPTEDMHMARWFLVAASSASMSCSCHRYNSVTHS